MITPPLRPRDEDAERGLLSSLLRDDCMAIALDEGVTESTFSDPLHLEIWKCMVTLDRDKEPVDEISVLQVLGSGVDRLGKENVWFVFNACETSGHATRFAQSAREAERRRKLQTIALQLLDSVEQNARTTDMVEFADRALFALHAQANGLIDGQRVDELAWEDFLLARASGGKNGAPTGIADLDYLLGGGLRNKTLSVLAARPSIGKTALALQFSALLADSKGVYFQSLEMNAASLGKRLISHMSGVPLQTIEAGKENDEQRMSLEKARRRLRDSGLMMDDKGGASMALARAKARRVKNLGLVVIDYCGLVTPSDTRVSREQQIAGISKDCKLLAEELDCPVMLLSQLNRSSEEANRAPRLSDLRESGALEQDADNVFLLHRPDALDRDSISLKLAKNRYGMTGLVSLQFDRDIQTFTKPATSFMGEVRKPYKS